MLSHVLDHFIFSSRRYTKKTKNIVFGVLASIIVLTFWWFKGAAFGISGPIAAHKGLQWRKVCDICRFFFLFLLKTSWFSLVLEYILMGQPSSRQFAFPLLGGKGGFRGLNMIYDSFFMC